METETEPTGRASVEEKHSFVSVPRAEPEKPEVYGGDDSEMRRAANDLTRNAPAPEPELMEVKYQVDPPPGKKFSVSVEEAARDLSAWHRGEYTRAENAAANEFAQVVDEVRQGAAATTPPESQPASEASQPPQTPQAQPEDLPEQPAKGLSPKLQAALSDPDIRRELEAPLQQAQVAHRAFTAGLTQNAELAVAAIVYDHPELNGLNAQQIPTALAIIEKQDPAKFAEIKARLAGAQGLVQQAQHAQAAQAQQAQAQFQDWASAQDDAFEASVKNENPDLVKRAKSEAPEILKSVYGIDPGALAHAYHTNPVLRSAAGQKLIYDAVQYQLAKQSATANPVRNIHPVQRPGTARAAGEASYEAIADMKSEFKKSSGLQQLRLGARLINARRSARS